MPRFPSNPQKGVNWICPFCDRPQTLTAGQKRVAIAALPISGHKYPDAIGASVSAIGCANPDCGEVTLSVSFQDGLATASPPYFTPHKNIENFQLRPSYLSKIQPDCIPQPLRDDYREACKIRDLSPKASATLARRVLQGMIRDFCGIKKGRLLDEINELQKRVNEGDAPKGVMDESVKAIDHVRNIGNIGAHMEKDINVIIDVDPGEAQALIELVELLFVEWYVTRQERNERLGRVTAIGKQKAQEKKTGKGKP